MAPRPPRALLDVAPERIAVVGASERQLFTFWVLENLRQFGFAGEIYPVHPHEKVVAGIGAYPSVAALPSSPDLGVIGIRADACLGALEELHARGCRSFILLSDGFAETGTSAGVAMERDIARWSLATGSTVIGPNGIGAANFSLGVVPLGMPVDPGTRAGPVSIVSQSGGILGALLAGLTAEGVGVDVGLSIGNGTAFGILDGLEDCLERPTTSVVAAYIEGFGLEGIRLRRVLEAYEEAGKRLVVLRPGRSETARRLLASHTASIAGPGEVVDDLLRRHGVARVSDVEELARAVHFALIAPELVPGHGVAVIGASGGAASVASDLALAHGVALPTYSDATRAEPSALVPESGFVGNPIDLSGRSATKVDVVRVYELIASDPTIGVLLLPFTAPFPDDAPRRHLHRDYLELLAGVSDRSGKPLVVASLAVQPVPEWTLRFAEAHERTSVVLGMATTMAAIGALVPSGDVATPASAAEPGSGPPARLLSEATGRALLEAAGFPVVRGEVCADAAEAVRVADSLSFPLVVKAVADGVAHKSELGGVELALCSAREVADACGRIADAFRGAPDVHLQGFLVEEMVVGTELLVGLVRDPDFGSSLTIGLGGALAETMGCHATAVLPLGTDGAFTDLLARAGLLELARRLDVLPLLSRLIPDLCGAFEHGPLSRFSTVEVNPLFLLADGRLVAGDVLVAGGDS